MVARRRPAAPSRHRFRPDSILRTIVFQSGVVLVAGIGAGVRGAVSLTRHLASLLPCVDPRDGSVFAIIMAVAVTVALIAWYLPARESVRVDHRYGVASRLRAVVDRRAMQNHGGFL